MVVDLPRCGPMLSPRVPNLVPIPGPRMERETPSQRPRPNYGHPQLDTLRPCGCSTPLTGIWVGHSTVSRCCRSRRRLLTGLWGWRRRPRSTWWSSRGICTTGRFRRPLRWRCLMWRWCVCTGPVRGSSRSPAITTRRLAWLWATRSSNGRALPSGAMSAVASGRCGSTPATAGRRSPSTRCRTSSRRSRGRSSAGSTPPRMSRVPAVLATTRSRVAPPR